MENRLRFLALLWAGVWIATVAGSAKDANWADDVIYFVIVDRFADGDPSNNDRVNRNAKGAFHGGDLKGLIQQLDEIADLGVTAIWITPVVKNIEGYVTGAGFPDWAYHGYWAEDFNEIDPRFGTEADLKTLVEEGAKRGIKILLDVVYNHPGYDSAYTKRKDAREWVRFGSECGSDDITQCLAGLPDFKTENPEVAEYLMDSHLGLAKRTGLAGFRLDTVKHVTHAFWQKHRERVNRELGEDFFLLGEVWGGDYRVMDDYFENDEMDAGFDFSFRGSAMAFLQGRGRTIAFSRYLMKRHKVRRGYLLSHYLSSHDEPGALHQLGGDKTLFKLTAALQMTTLGAPMIYYGEEVGRIGGDWPENRSDMPWGERPIQPGAGDARDEDMRAFYKKLIATRRANPPLWGGDYEELSVEGDLLVFARVVASPRATAIVAVNRGDAPATASVATPPDWRGRTVTEALSDAETKADGDVFEIKAPAKTALIFTVKQ